jgi:hypothetical protein
MAKNAQFELAKNLGYVESMGSETVRRGDLVPYDHDSSPLTDEEIRVLKEKGFAPGKILPGAWRGKGK